jgi:hypothetical protein
MAKIVYRYDNEDYVDGHLICSRGDSFNMLTDVEKVVELRIRELLPDGANIRGNSLYTWEDETVAQRLWGYSRKQYLYELEVDEANIRHVGDLDLYSDAKDAVKNKVSPDAPITAYCNGEVAPPERGGPRREILVSEARVIRKLASR